MWFMLGLLKGHCHLLGALMCHFESTPFGPIMHTRCFKLMMCWECKAGEEHTLVFMIDELMVGFSLEVEACEFEEAL